VAAIAAAAAAAVIGITGQLSPAAPAHSEHTRFFAGANPHTRVRANAVLTAATWGTSIRLVIRGAPLNVRCRLVVRAKDGETETAGVWDAWREGPINVPASAGWRPSDIASLQIVAGHRTLVTIGRAAS